MKKLLSIFLLLIYTATSSGTVMSAHFCMGKLAGISIGEKEQSSCGYCGMEDDGCCHDLLKVVKIDDSHLQKTAGISLDNVFFLAPVNYVVSENQRFFNNHNFQQNTSSYFLGGPPRYLRNCVFRI